MLRVAVVGSRTFKNYDFLCEKLDALRFMIGDFQVVSGGAQGAGLLAARWANEYKGLPVPEIINAEWTDLSQSGAIIKTRRDGTKYDATAGMRRNAILVASVDAVVAFWDGSSKGTRDTLQRAYQAHLPTMIWHPERTPQYHFIEKLNNQDES
jgi:hypothetical protein